MTTYLLRVATFNFFVHFNNICINDTFFIPGASLPCCQGSNPSPQAARICGWFFNIATLQDNGAAQNPVCGKYNMAIGDSAN